MDFDEAFEEFSKAAKNLKEAYAMKECINSNDIAINVNEDNVATIIPNARTFGNIYTSMYRNFIE